MKKNKNIPLFNFDIIYDPKPQKYKEKT